MAVASAERKHAALIGAADAIIASEQAILDANVLDMDFAAEKGLSPSMLDRLKLDSSRIRAMADGLRSAEASAKASAASRAAVPSLAISASASVWVRSFIAVSP